MKSLEKLMSASIAEEELLQLKAGAMEEETPVDTDLGGKNVNYFNCMCFPPNSTLNCGVLNDASKCSIPNSMPLCNPLNTTPTCGKTPNTTPSCGIVINPNGMCK